MAHGGFLSEDMVAAVARELTRRKPSAGALAVFVKTPELSPVKTRLAADIGQKKALRVYEALLARSAAMMREVRRAGVAVCWAVGEAEGVRHARWKEFPAIHTGEGDLGERLHNVYSTLQAQYGRVALAGSDCPQLSAETVCAALARAHGRVVVGPSEDGGFYLFVAARRIPERVWLGAPYSQADTLSSLLCLLAPAEVETLVPLPDVDDACALSRIPPGLLPADAP